MRMVSRSTHHHHHRAVARRCRARDVQRRIAIAQSLQGPPNKEQNNKRQHDADQKKQKATAVHARWWMSHRGTDTALRGSRSARPLSRHRLHDRITDNGCTLRRLCRAIALPWPLDRHRRARSKIQELEPTNDAKRALQSRELNAIADLTQSRLALFAQAHDSLPAPFLAILIFWLAIIFASFGLFVRPNRIVIVTFIVGSLSVAGAIFLILEMERPFAGLLQISSEPLRHVLAPLGP
jgi:hypothetical protein